MIAAAVPDTPQAFPEQLEEEFLQMRREGISLTNSSTYWFVALALLGFSAWDWLVDADNWIKALPIRLAGATCVVFLGILQQRSARPDWAPRIAKMRFFVTIATISSALAIVEQGYVLGVAGLVTTLAVGPYITVDRRDFAWLYAAPVACIAVVMLLTNVPAFVAANAATFLLLSVAVAYKVTSVFESVNRRSFLLERKLAIEARTDALTGLKNRRAIEEFAIGELHRADHSGGTLSAVLCDIDHFKQVNDTHGHIAGDQVIQAVSRCIGESIRATDIACRWGGEEFLLVLPDTSLHDATLLAERLRGAAEGARWPLPEGARGLTLSLGVASTSRHMHADTQLEQWVQLIKAADQALYLAKQSGRNKVVAASRP